MASKLVSTSSPFHCKHPILTPTEVARLKDTGGRGERGTRESKEGDSELGEHRECVVLRKRVKESEDRVCGSKGLLEEGEK